MLFKTNVNRTDAEGTFHYSEAVFNSCQAVIGRQDFFVSERSSILVLGMREDKCRVTGISAPFLDNVLF